MKKTIILIVGIVSMAAVSLPVFAHGPGWGGGPRGSGYNNDCPYSGYVNDDLTQEQRTALHALRDEYRANTDRIREQLREKRSAMRTELNRQQPDESRVRGLQAEISDLKGQMDGARIDHMLKAKKIDPDISPRTFRKNNRLRNASCYNRQ
ncbi:MAG TPA: periplasmic heavy metal sensor [Deltaproteobacteria bacterium]|nr:periplasmic heavy metal sensor [Deltaproteobacteria bacterium]